jgi:hypothetical protein
MVGFPKSLHVCIQIVCFLANTLGWILWSPTSMASCDFQAICAKAYIQDLMRGHHLQIANRFKTPSGNWHFSLKCHDPKSLIYLTTKWNSAFLFVEDTLRDLWVKLICRYVCSALYKVNLFYLLWMCYYWLWQIAFALYVTISDRNNSFHIISILR